MFLIRITFFFPEILKSMKILFPMLTNTTRFQSRYQKSNVISYKAYPPTTSCEALCVIYCENNSPWAYRYTAIKTTSEKRNFHATFRDASENRRGVQMFRLPVENRQLNWSLVVIFTVSATSASPRLPVKLQKEGNTCIICTQSLHQAVFYPNRHNYDSFSRFDHKT